MIKDLFKKYKEIFLYAFFGVLTTLVNWILYYIFTNFLFVPYLFSTAISQLLAILFAYTTNRIWVFESKAVGFKNIGLEMLRFFLFRGVSFVLDLVLMYVGVDILKIDDFLMKLIANIIIIIANYAFSKLFVFKKKDPSGSED